ncbi:hypothetical protein DERP_000317 [Dermatophagoides pteronyssinus]|uniref:Uncharacterized protein n=1 Tax=Dermatophagoides pteronyssinus TaxID=6956 RepID=A0ABQ8IZS4_DERPT|nr:hypothetical protein DERP_000317 [Dermatophagoides pteronyssinus]
MNICMCIVIDSEIEQALLSALKCYQETNRQVLAQIEKENKKKKINCSACQTEIKFNSIASARHSNSNGPNMIKCGFNRV